MPQIRRRIRLSQREKRLLIYVGIALAVVGVDRLRRWWRPDFTVETTHYIVYSTATPEHTNRIAAAAEALHQSYTEFFQPLLPVQPPAERFQLKLFKNQAEFRRCNRVTWAEALYRRPYCYAYYNDQEEQPQQWMVHEATHQLNAELAGFDLPRWLDEGIAEYFSTSRYQDGRITLGEIEKDSYPIWWIAEIAPSGDLTADLAQGSFIPLRTIVADKGGPDIDQAFNLYYLHWWSLVHFLLHYDNARYRQGFFTLVQHGGTPAAFQTHIGPFEEIQPQWYTHTRQLRSRL